MFSLSLSLSISVLARGKTELKASKKTQLFNLALPCPLTIPYSIYRSYIIYHHRVSFFYQRLKENQKKRGPKHTLTSLTWKLCRVYPVVSSNCSMMSSSMVFFLKAQGHLNEMDGAHGSDACFGGSFFGHETKTKQILPLPRVSCSSRAFGPYFSLCSVTWTLDSPVLGSTL